MNKIEDRLEDLIESRLQDPLGRLDQAPDSDPGNGIPPLEADPLEPLLSAADWLRQRRSTFEADRKSLAVAGQNLCLQLPLQHRTAARYRPAYSPSQLAAQLLMALALFAAGFLAANSLVNASQTWLPGDRLYGLKTAQEALALDLTASPARRASLHIQYAERRMLEAQALALEGNFDQLPATVADFSEHVARAVQEVRLAATGEPALGAKLAVQLEQTLNGQAALVGLLAQVSPEPGSGQFRLLLSVSQEGIAGLEEVLRWGGG